MIDMRIAKQREVVDEREVGCDELKLSCPGAGKSQMQSELGT